MLPVRVDVAVFPIMQYPPGYPPCMPQITVHPTVQLYLPEVVTAAINELGGKAYANSSRMFAYNLYSQNNWNNAEFTDLIKFAADMLAVTAVMNPSGNIQRELNETVSSAITLKTSALVLQYPELKAMLPPMLVDAAMQNANAMSQRMQMIQNTLHNQQPQGNIMQGNPMQPNIMMDPMGRQYFINNFGQVQYLQNAPVQQPQYPAQQQSFGTPVPQMNVMYDQQGRPYTTDPQGRPYYIDQRQPTPQQVYGQIPHGQQQPQIYNQPSASPYAHAVPNKASGRWASEPQQQQSFGSPPQQAPAGNPISQAEHFDRFNRRQPAQQEPDRYAHQRSYAQVPQSEPPQVAQAVPVQETLTTNDWTPSLEDPYRLLCNRLTHRIEYYRSASGNVIQKLVKKEDHEIMERDKHRIARAKAEEEKILEWLDKNEVIPFHKQKAREIMKEKAAEENIDLTTVEHDALWVDNFLSPALTEASLQKRLAEEKSPHNVFRFEAVVANPSIVHGSTHSLLKHFSECSTLTALATRMAAVKQASETTDDKSKVSKSTQNWVADIDRRLTASVNEFIRCSLSLPGVTIDSFTEDFGQLRQYLFRKFGERYSMALEIFDKSAANQMLMEMDESVAEQLTENIVDGKTKDTDITVAFAPETYSVTFVDLDSKNIDVKFEGSLPALIPYEGNAMLFKVAQNVFTRHESRMHNLIVTSDGVTYKLHKGMLGLESYLLTPFCCA